MFFLKFMWAALLKPCAEVLFAVVGMFYIAGFITLVWVTVPFTEGIPTAARIIFAALYWPAILGWLGFYFYDEWISLKQDATRR